MRRKFVSFITAVLVGVFSAWGQLNNNALDRMQSDGYKIFYSNIHSVFKEGVKEETTKKTIVPPIYDKIVSYDGALKIFVVLSDSHYGVVNSEGNEVIPTKYSKIGSFNDGIAIVDEPGKGLGYIDYTGKVVAPCQYQSAATYFCEGRAFVKIGDQYGVIDTEGKEVVKPKYDEIENFHEGRARVIKDSLCGFIDTDGSEVVPPQYQRAENFSEGGFAFVQKGGKWGTIDKKGKIIIPFEYEWAIIWHSLHNQIYFRKGNKMSLTDFKGNMLIPASFDLVYPFHDDRAAVVSNGKLGYVDKNGQLVIPCKYEPVIGNFEDYTKCSYEEFKTIDEGYKFFGNVAFVKYEGKYLLIDKNGNEVNGKRYDTPNPYWKTVIETRRDNHNVFVSLDGKEYSNRRQAQLSSWADITGRINDFEAETQCVIGSYFAYGWEDFNQPKDPHKAVEWLSEAWKKGLKGLNYRGSGRYEHDIAYMLSKCNYKIEDIAQPSQQLATLKWQSEQISDTEVYSLKAGIKSESAITEVHVLVNGQLSRGLSRVYTHTYDQVIDKVIMLNEGENNIEVTVKNKAGEASFHYIVKYTPQKQTKPAQELQKKDLLQDGKQTKNRVALVIGNASYQTEALKTPVIDAEAVTRRLQEMGYDVLLVKDATKKEIETRLNEFGKIATLSEAALFYYAGHGISTNDNANYMIPIDALELINDADIENTCVKMSWVLDQLADAKANIKILMLDNCRTKLNGGQNAQRFSNYQPMNKDCDNGIIIYATSNEKGAFDGKGMYSPFAEATLSAWETPHIDIDDFANHIKEVVNRKTSGAQKAWVNSSFFGKFYF